MGRPRALTAVVQPVTRAALGRKRSVLGSLIAAWPTVAGEDIARRTVPDKVTLSGAGGGLGVLVLRVASADALSIEYAVPELRERINAHYGYQAVSRIKLVQSALPGRLQPPAATGQPPAPVALEPSLVAALATVADDDLRQSLAALGQAIRAREAIEDR